MARRLFPPEVREDLGAGAGDDEASPRRASGSPAQEGPRVERLEWAMAQKHSGPRLDPGMTVMKSGDARISAGACRALGVTQGDTVAVGWSREHHHAVVRPIAAADPRAAKLRRGGQLGRLVAKFLVRQGFVPGLFYRGQVRDRELVVPLPAEKGTDGGRTES